MTYPPEITYNPIGAREQKIFIGNSLLCTIERPYSWQHHDQLPGWNVGHSYAWVCPQCLRNWALAPMERETTFVILPLRCPSCGGGALFHRWGKYVFDSALLDFAPHELLYRELSYALQDLTGQGL